MNPTCGQVDHRAVNHRAVDHRPSKQRNGLCLGGATDAEGGRNHRCTTRAVSIFQRATAKRERPVTRKYSEFSIQYSGTGPSCRARPGQLERGRTRKRINKHNTNPNPNTHRHRRPPRRGKATARSHNPFCGAGIRRHYWTHRRYKRARTAPPMGHERRTRTAQHAQRGRGGKQSAARAGRQGGGEDRM